MNRLRVFFISAFLVVFSIFSTAFAEDYVFGRLSGTIRGGIKRGGIVGKSSLDGVSGATRTLWNAAVEAEVAIKGHYIETGLSVGETDQHVEYYPLSPDPLVASGERNIKLLLLDIPLLYNFHFFPLSPLHRENGRLVVGAGVFASFVLSKEITAVGSPMPEKLSTFALGPFFRVSVYPVEISGISPGLYFDYYRSMAPKYFYDHPYFKQNGIAGQLGTMNFGMCLRM
jgi:hypothetical protein